MMEDSLVCPTAALKDFHAPGQGIRSMEREDTSGEIKSEIKVEDSTEYSCNRDKTQLLIGKYELVELDSESDVEEDFHAVVESMKYEETEKLYIEQPVLSGIHEIRICGQDYSPDDKRFQSLCRLCAFPCNYMIDIFDSTTLHKSIIEKIRHCLPIKVKETDTLTKWVCLSCLEKLESCYRFHENVTQAEKQLLLLHEQNLENENLRKNNAATNEGVEKIETPELGNLDSDSETRSSICENQNTETWEPMGTLNLSRTSVLQSTQNVRSDAPLSPISRELMEELESEQGMSDSVDDLLPNIREESEPRIKTHPITTIKSSYSLRKRRPQKYNRYDDGFLSYGKAAEGHDPARRSVDYQSIQCQICNETCQTIEKWQMHAGTHTSSNYHPCCLCNKILESETERIQHWSQHWSQHVVDDAQSSRSEKRASIHSCDVCGKYFASAIGLQKHKLYHEPVVNNAEHCKKNNIVLDSKTCMRKILLQHMTVAHNDDEISSGHESGAQFRSEEKLNACQTRHMVRCTYCRRKFPSDVRLEEHKKICFENREKYPCGCCTKVFNWKSDLQRHMLSHTGERPHTCDICSKTFRRNSYMIKHRRLHTDERPFKCSMCSTTFHTSWKLRLHTDHVHLKKLHPCSLCHKEFKNASSIKNHMAIHTKEKLYKCDLCQAQFTWSSTLSQHKRRTHGQYGLKNQV